jgi:hypothetical protein
MLVREQSDNAPNYASVVLSLPWGVALMWGRPRAARRNTCFRVRLNRMPGRLVATDPDEAHLRNATVPQRGRHRTSVRDAGLSRHNAQAIKSTDAQGRSFIYVLVTRNRKLVDSQGFMLDPEND